MHDDEFELSAAEPTKPKRKKKKETGDGGGQEIKVKRKASTPEEKAKSESAVVRVEGYYQIAFKNRWGFPVILREARDRAILKLLIEQWDEKAVKRTIDEYMNSTDPEVRRSRFYNIPDFGYWAPKLRMQLAGGGVMMHDRTASNAHEVMKAMGRGRPANKED